MLLARLLLIYAYNWIYMKGNSIEHEILELFTHVLCIPTILICITWCIDLHLRCVCVCMCAGLLVFANNTRNMNNANPSRTTRRIE